VTKSEPQSLGRNDASPPSNPGAYRTTPKLEDSDLFPGMTSVKPEEGGRYESRTGSAGSGKQ